MTMPTFTWQEPNIRAVPEAVWTRRFRVPGCQACYEAGWITDFSGGYKPPCPNSDPAHGGIWEAGVQAPGKAEGWPRKYRNVGDAFYRTLINLGYRLTKRRADDLGEYR